MTQLFHDSSKDAGYCLKCQKGYAIGPHVCPTELPPSKELVEQVLSENPYPDYSYTAQNCVVECERATRYARSMMAEVLRRAVPEPRTYADTAGTYSSDEPAPARQPSKFDLAFEIMRQLEAEDMETMQSCQFGYVMRVTKEGHGCGQVEFRPIETALKDGSTILLRCPKGIVEGCWEQVDGGGHPENGPPIYWWTSPFTEFIDGPYDAPTHWALIPRDAPTKESAQ